MLSMTSDAERVQKTLDALVDEAYRKAVASGMAITNPDGWRLWKRGIYIATAKREGAGYLKAQYQRLGVGAAYPTQRTCAKCGERVHGHPSHTDENGDYCSLACAGIQAVSLSEWLETATDEQRDAMNALRNTRRLI